MGVQPYLKPIFMSSTYEITGLQYTYGNATLSTDYVG